MAQYFEPLTKEKLKLIYDEFGATEASVKNDVDTLIEWIEKQSHLPNVTDREWLTHFLICCKNSLERTKQKLEEYYTVRAQSPDFFSGRAELIDTGTDFSRFMSFVPLPKLTKDGKRVIILRIFPGNDFPFTSDALVKYAQIAYDVIVKVDYASQYIMIFDMENMTLPIVAVAFPAMKKLVAQLTKINPFRFHKLYVLNVSAAVEPLVNFGISLLSKKLASRSVVWKKKLRELVEEIDEDILPPRYGGTENPVEVLRDTWVKYMFSFKDWLVAEELVKCDLSKKFNENGSTLNVGEYGIEGTFRKINLD